MATPDVETSRFVLMKGNITNVVVVSGEEEFIQTETHKAVGTGLAATLAMSGLAGAAMGAMLSVSGSADSVEFFTATVNGQRIAGRFSKVWFKNGDDVEVVGELKSDGSFAVYAVRCDKYKTLWMFPHCSRGSRAHWIFSFKIIPIIIAILSVLGSFFIWLCVSTSDERWSTNAIWFMFWVFNINWLLIGFYFPIKFGWKWRPFVAIAEKVFSVLGYENPSNVDMEKQDSLYWKKYAKLGEQKHAAPWVFRYVTQK